MKLCWKNPSRRKLECRYSELNTLDWTVSNIYILCIPADNLCLTFMFFSHSFTQSLTLCPSVLLTFKCLQLKKKILTTKSFILISLLSEYGLHWEHLGGCNSFMGSYKFFNMIVEFYNARREVRQFCILVIKSFDPLSTHARRPRSYLHKWMGFCSINMYLCIWLFTL